MAQSYINDGESGASVRAKLNDRWQVLAQSNVGVSCPADTNENALASITVHAGAMGPNGRLRITTLWSMTSSANNKQTRVRFSGASGTTYLTAGHTTVASLRDQREIGNRNSESLQVGSMPGAPGGFSTSSGVVTTSAVDTTVDTTVVITGQKANAGETLTLESYIVELLYAS
jgi:hypothetical protein